MVVLKIRNPKLEIGNKNRNSNQEMMQTGHAADRATPNNASLSGVALF